MISREHNTRVSSILFSTSYDLVVNINDKPVPGLGTTEVRQVLDLNEASSETPSTPCHVEIEDPRPRQSRPATYYIAPPTCQVQKRARSRSTSAFDAGISFTEKHVLLLPRWFECMSLPLLFALIFACGLETWVSLFPKYFTAQSNSLKSGSYL